MDEQRLVSDIVASDYENCVKQEIAEVLVDFAHRVFKDHIQPYCDKYGASLDLDFGDWSLVLGDSTDPDPHLYSVVTEEDYLRTWPDAPPYKETMGVVGVLTTEVLWHELGDWMSAYKPTSLEGKP